MSKCYTVCKHPHVNAVGISIWYMHFLNKTKSTQQNGRNFQEFHVDMFAIRHSSVFMFLLLSDLDRLSEEIK